MSQPYNRYGRYIGFIALLFLATAAHAQNRHTLWKIESNTGTVYLLGSLHLLKQTHYPLSPVIESAFQEAQTVIVEADLDSLNMPETQLMAGIKAMYQSGSLRESISENTYRLVRVKADELGINIQQLNPFKPWFCALTLVAVKLQQLGFQQQYGIDRYFFDKAKQAGKRIGSLEAVGEQIDFLASLPSKSQEDLLLQALKDMEIVEQFFDEMYTAWSQGDTGKLGSLMTKSFEGYPVLYERLLTARNKNWVPQIEQFLRESGTYFVIVGAGHLAGDNSVIDMLRQKGYKVEQM